MIRNSSCFIVDQWTFSSWAWVKTRTPFCSDNVLLVSLTCSSPRMVDVGKSSCVIGKSSCANGLYCVIQFLFQTYSFFISIGIAFFIAYRWLIMPYQSLSILFCPKSYHILCWWTLHVWLTVPLTNAERRTVRRSTRDGGAWGCTSCAADLVHYEFLI